MVRSLENLLDDRTGAKISLNEGLVYTFIGSLPTLVDSQQNNSIHYLCYFLLGAGLYIGVRSSCKLLKLDKQIKNYSLATRQTLAS